MARKEIAERANTDLKTYATLDGWFISVRAAVEEETLRLMQVISATESRQGVNLRTLECNLLWQDHCRLLYRMQPESAKYS